MSSDDGGSDSCCYSSKKVMVRNVPYKFRQENIEGVLQAYGFSGQWEKIELPRSHGSNPGYAFITFNSPEAASAFQDRLTGYTTMAGGRRWTWFIEPANEKLANKAKLKSKARSAVSDSSSSVSRPSGAAYSESPSEPSTRASWETSPLWQTPLSAHAGERELLLQALYLTASSQAHSQTTDQSAKPMPLGGRPSYPAATFRAAPGLGLSAPGDALAAPAWQPEHSYLKFAPEPPTARELDTYSADLGSPADVPMKVFPQGDLAAFAAARRCPSPPRQPDAWQREATAAAEPYGACQPITIFRF